MDDIVRASRDSRVNLLYCSAQGLYPYDHKNNNHYVPSFGFKYAIDIRMIRDGKPVFESSSFRGDSQKIYYVSSLERLLHLHRYRHPITFRTLLHFIRSLQMSEVFKRASRRASEAVMKAVEERRRVMTKGWFPGIPSAVWDRLKAESIRDGPSKKRSDQVQVVLRCAIDFWGHLRTVGEEVCEELLTSIGFEAISVCDGDLNMHRQQLREALQASDLADELHYMSLRMEGDIQQGLFMSSERYRASRRSAGSFMGLTEEEALPNIPWDFSPVYSSSEDDIEEEDDIARRKRMLEIRYNTMMK